MSWLKNKNSGSVFSSWSNDIEEELLRNGTSFSKELFYLIDTKGLTDVEVYTRARIDRRLFSKIRKRGYLPGRKTIIALIFALELNYSESINLLSLAGFTLSTAPSMPFDIIITKAITSQMYDIVKVNELLIRYGLPLING